MSSLLSKLPLTSLLQSKEGTNDITIGEEDEFFNNQLT